MQFWYSVKRVLIDADVIVEVLDARLPELSRSPDIEDLVAKSGKPLIFAVNKSDLVPRQMAEQVKRSLGEDRCVFVSGKKNLGMRLLKEKIFTLAHQRGKQEPKVCFVGYPNVGKSSIINAIAKRAKTAVSPKVGTTRGIQWVNAGGLRILDSPGVIPVEINDEARIALLSARDPEKLKYPERAALTLIRFLRESHPGRFESYYKLTGDDENDLIIDFARKKHFLLKGGEIDLRRAALTLIREWQRGIISFNDLQDA